MTSPFVVFAQTNSNVVTQQPQKQVGQTQVAQIKNELNLKRFLYRGVTGEDVKGLQTFLKSQYPDLYTAPITGYFGLLTESAVKKLQEKQGIESIGIVGPKTTAKINELITKSAGGRGVAPLVLPKAPTVQGSDTTISAPAVSSPLPALTTTVSAGGGGGGGGSSGSVAVSSSQTSNTASTTPPSTTLSASPSTITAGQTSILTLTSYGAYGGCFGTNLFSGNTSGNVTVSPATTTSYSVTCYNGPGEQAGLSNTKTVTLNVQPAGSPGPIITLSANPTTITAGEPTTITLSQTGAYHCINTGGSGPNNQGGGYIYTFPYIKQEYPSITWTFSYTCYTGPNATGLSSSASVMVNVNSEPAPTVNAFSLSSNSITVGQPITIAISSSGADSCFLAFPGGRSGGNVSPNGSTTTYPTISGTYTLTCWPQPNRLGVSTQLLSGSVQVSNPELVAPAGAPAGLGMYTGSSSGGWGIDGTWCSDNNNSNSNDAGVCQDNSGTYADMCINSTSKTGYWCSGSFGNGGYIGSPMNLRCVSMTNSYNVSGYSCYLGGFSLTSSQPSGTTTPPTGTTTRSTPRSTGFASVLNALYLTIQELKQLLR